MVRHDHFFEEMVQVFAITALWDVVLRLFATGKLRWFGINNWNWVKTLQPYFAKHTVLGAALLAGFAGAVAFAVIKAWTPTPTKSFVGGLVVSAIHVAIVSALVGIPMRYTNLFPYLKTYYYEKLPVTTAFSDALSGVVVAVTFVILKAVASRLKDRR